MWGFVSGQFRLDKRPRLSSVAGSERLERYGCAEEESQCAQQREGAGRQGGAAEECSPETQGWLSVSGDLQESLNSIAGAWIVGWVDVVDLPRPFSVDLHD
jgi:hypothetical protein